MHPPIIPINLDDGPESDLHFTLGGYTEVWLIIFKNMNSKKKTFAVNFNNLK